MIRIGLSLMCVLMSSCVHHSNERLLLGSRYQTASFGGGFTVLDSEQQPRPRERWASVVLVAPTDGTITGQTLRTPKYLDDSGVVSGRVYGLYPTMQSAIRSTPTGWLVDGLDTLDELGRSIGEVVLMPYRALVYSLVAPRTWSPERSWKRTNQQGPSSWSSGQPRVDDLDGKEIDEHANDG